MDNVTELPTDLYANAFSSLQPRRAHNILIGRLKAARSFNEELADYFRDRCAIEDQYVKSLLKLSKKPNGLFNSGLQHSSTSTNEDEELSGGVGKIKELLQSELIDLMDAHSKLQTKVQVEVEAAFRNCKILSHSNWNQVRNLEDSLNVAIKNYEDVELKLNKSKAKLNGTTNIKKIQSFQIRVAEDQKNVTQARQTYLDQAPMIYQSYQSFDKMRLVNLFESLTKFETLQADHSREKMEIFERSMMNLLNFDCQEEMRRFALRNGNITSAIAGAVRDSRSSSVAQPNPRTTPTPPGSQTPHSSSPATNLHHDRAPAGGDREQEHPNPTPVLSSSSVPLPSGPGTSNPQTASPTPYDPNHASIPKLSTPNIHVPIRPATPETASIAPPSRDLYVQRQTSIKSISRMYRSGSSNNGHRLHASPSSVSINQTSKPSGSQSITDKLFNKSRFTQILSRSTGAGARLRSGTNTSQANRSTMYESGQPESNDGARPLQTRTSSLVDSNPATDQGNLYEVLGLDTDPDRETAPRSKRLSQPSIIPTRKVSRSAPSLPIQSSQTPPVPKQAERPKLDAEGFTIPPEDRDRKPWETADGTEVLDDDDEGTRTTGGSRTGNENENGNSERSNGNLAGLSQFAIKVSPSKPTDESESERQAAIQKVQNTLASVSIGTSALGGLGPTRRSTTGLRGRRGDGRGVTMYDASTPPVPLGLNRAASVSRDNSTDNVPLSVVQAMKQQQSREAQQEIPAESSQSQLTTFPTPFTLTPIGSNPSSPSRITSSAPDMSQNQSSATQSGFSVRTADEETTQEVRSNSEFSSMSNVTSAFGPAPGSGGTNPFLNRSFSPPIISPTFTFNPSASISSRRGEATGRRTYAAHGLTAVVRETLNVLMDGGLVTKVLVLGEVRLVWPSVGEQGEVRFKLSHHDRLEKVICQGTAVRSGSEPGEYILDVKAFRLAEEESGGSGSGQIVLKYRIYLDTKTAEEADVRRFVPLQVVPRWRALRLRTELVLLYEPNSTFHRFDSEQAPLPPEWRLEDLGISARLYNPDGKSINPAQVVQREIVDQQSVPAGLWDSEGKEMRWGVDAIGPSSGPQRIIGRFIHPEAAESDGGTEVESAEFTRANCGPVQVRWKMRGTCVSGIELEIVGHDQLAEGSVVERFEEVLKMVVTGTFLAR